MATYRRTERLGVLLGDLAAQRSLPAQVVVVDNDAAGSAQSIVKSCRASAPFPIDYDIQPTPSIAITRNRTVELASGEWLAFIDDDERAPNDWLQRLLYAAESFQADGVLAPVEPQVPHTAPSWIRRGRFYDFPRQADGDQVPLNRMRFGNVLLRAERLRALSGPFDPSLGLAGGEDVDVLVRLSRTGAKIVWYNQATVYEPIETKRLSLRWLLLRAFSGGQGFARYSIEGGFGPIGWSGTCLLFVRAASQLVVAIGLAALCVPFGRHRAAAWLIKSSANLGKITAMWGARYSAYQRPPAQMH